MENEKDKVIQKILDEIIKLPKFDLFYVNQLINNKLDKCDIFSEDWQYDYAKKEILNKINNLNNKKYKYVRTILDNEENPKKGVCPYCRTELIFEPSDFKSDSVECLVCFKRFYLDKENIVLDFDNTHSNNYKIKYYFASLKKQTKYYFLFGLVVNILHALFFVGIPDLSISYYLAVVFGSFLGSILFSFLASIPVASIFFLIYRNRSNEKYLDYWALIFFIFSVLIFYIFIILVGDNYDSIINS